MRDDNNTGNWHSVSSVAGSQQTINDPLFAVYKDSALWRVQTVWSVSCSPTYKHSNTNYNSSFSNIFTNRTSGIHNTAFETQVVIYPNPCADQLSIKLNKENYENVVISILDITGKTIMQTVTSESEYVFKTENLAKGLYLVKVETEKTVLLQKVIKK